jgi:rhodanese-related sulfurtransferase
MNKLSSEVELIDINSLMDWSKTENNLQLIDVRSADEFNNG